MKTVKNNKSSDKGDKSNDELHHVNSKITKKKVKKRFTKPEILTYFKEYYVKHNVSPKAKDKSNPFCNKVVARHFGDWSRALLAAGLPLYKNKKVYVTCKNCSIVFLKSYNEAKRYGNNYCTRSCAAIYNNKYRTHGGNVSKLEVYLQKELIVQNNKGSYIFKLLFEFNNRLICNGYELDIYIPTLKLAFEINGIFHYKPIFGQDKLDNIIRKDVLKNTMCKENGITLITIKDTSHKFSAKYGDVIFKIIDQHIHQHIHKQLFKPSLRLLTVYF